MPMALVEGKVRGSDASRAGFVCPGNGTTFNVMPKEIREEELDRGQGWGGGGLPYLVKAQLSAEAHL